MRTHTVTAAASMEDLSRHDSDVIELGSILQRLAALGDREWLEDILALARKRLVIVERIKHEHEPH